MPDSTADYFSPSAFEQSCATSGLDLSQIADELGVTTRTLRNLTHGRVSPSLAVLKRAAELFGTQIPDYLDLPDRGKWNLHHLRLANGYTQRAVADHVGVSQALVSNWETGNYAPPAESISKIAVAFGVSERRVREAVDVTAATAATDRERSSLSAATFGLAEEILSSVDEVAGLVDGDAVDTTERAAFLDQIRDRIEDAMVLIGNLIPQLAPVRRAGAYRRFSRLRDLYDEVSALAGKARGG